jgi:hypothetical protein
MYKHLRPTDGSKLSTALERAVQFAREAARA